MKKILTLFFACALSMAMQAQTKHNVYVWVDGEKTLIENADSITFSEPTTPPAGDEEAVDLGLSVKWAQRNLGAENPWVVMGRPDKSISKVTFFPDCFPTAKPKRGSGKVKT